MPDPKNDTNDSFLFTGLGLLLLTLPIFFGSVYRWSLFPQVAVIFLLSAVYSESLCDSRRFSKGYLYAGVLFLMLLGLHCGFVSRIRDISLEEYLLWLASAAALLLPQGLSVSRIAQLLGLLCFSALLQSLYAYFLLLNDSDKVLWVTKQVHLGYFTGTFMNRNHFAAFLELALGAHVGLSVFYAKRREFLKASLVACSMTVVMSAFYRTGSRMGILSFWSAVLVCGLMWLCFSRKKLAIGAVGGLIVLVSGVLFALNAGPWIERFDPANLLRQGWEGGRMLVWKDALWVLRDHWFQGTGLGVTKWIYPMYQSERVLQGWDHFHNDYLEAVCEMGVPLFLCFMVLCFTGICWMLLRFMKREDDSCGGVLLGLMIGFLSFLIHSIADFNFAIPSNRLLFFILTGLALRMLTDDSSFEGEGC